MNIVNDLSYIIEATMPIQSSLNVIKMFVLVTPQLSSKMDGAGSKK